MRSALLAMCSAMFSVAWQRRLAALSLRGTHNTSGGGIPAFLHMGVPVCRAAGVQGLMGGAASVVVPPAAAVGVGDLVSGHDLPSGSAGWGGEGAARLLATPFVVPSVCVLVGSGP